MNRLCSLLWSWRCWYPGTPGEKRHICYSNQHLILAVRCQRSNGFIKSRYNTISSIPRKWYSWVIFWEAGKLPLLCSLWSARRGRRTEGRWWRGVGNWREMSTVGSKSLQEGRNWLIGRLHTLRHLRARLKLVIINVALHATFLAFLKKFDLRKRKGGKTSMWEKDTLTVASHTCPD